MVSKATLIVLVVLAVLAGVVGTWTVVSQANTIQVTEHPAVEQSGKVSLTLLDTEQSQQAIG